MRKIIFLLGLFSIGLHVKAQRVGIGTSNPDSTLDVRGNIKFGGLNKFLAYDSASGKISWSNSHLFLPNNQQLIQHSASAEGLFYNNSALQYRNQLGLDVFSTNWSNGISYFGGNVGIRHPNPIAPLSFSSEIGKKISFYGDTSPHYGIGIQGYLMQLHTDLPESDIAFGYGSSDAFSETMRIKGNGNVGIGTTSPGAKLHIQNGISGFPYYNGNLIIETNANNYLSFFTPDNYQSAILFEKPAHLQSGGIYYNSPSAPNGIILRANNAPRVYITANGNTGIGMSPVSEKLEVNGSIKADSFKFTSPRTYYYSIDASAFITAEGNMEVRNFYTHGAYSLGSTTIPLVASVSLPHNAILRGITAYIYDVSPALSLDVILARRENSFGRLQMGSVSSTGSAGVVGYNMNFPTDPFWLPTYTVDNLNNSYLVYAVPGPGSQSWPSNGDLQIKRVVIAYTLSGSE